jgi:lysozyme family protein
MKYNDTFLLQTGLKSLGFDPGPIDGVRGPKTEAARAKWLASLHTTDVVDSVASLQLQRWEAATVLPSRIGEVQSVCDYILANKARYSIVESSCGVPWWVVGALHNMEASGSFTKHLHNGDPLSARTVQVPKGRPLNGNPPFTWEFSAVDALQYDHLDQVNWTDIASALYACERYNGLGYMKYHPETPTPYLWAATSVEKPGKYVADGQWNPTARSGQIGVAAIWKMLGPFA